MMSPECHCHKTNNGFGIIMRIGIIYRTAGNSRGVLNFIISVVDLAVTIIFCMDLHMHKQ